MGRSPRFHLDHLWTRRRIDAYVDGDLPQDERRRAARHVGECPDCGRVATGLRRLLTGLASLSSPDSGRPRLASRVVARLDADRRKERDDEAVQR